MSKTVITYGTFDMFHIGHLRLLQRQKELGDRLIVAVSTDEFSEEKNKKLLIPYEQRVEIIADIKCVDEVIAEESWEQKISDIEKYDVDIFSMGKDWEGKFDFLKEYCEVVYLERTKNISTTKLKRSLSNFLKPVAIRSSPLVSKPSWCAGPKKATCTWDRTPMAQVMRWTSALVGLLTRNNRTLWVNDLFYVARISAKTGGSLLASNHWTQKKICSQAHILSAHMMEGAVAKAW